jgi:hypothetical protein
MANFEWSRSSTKQHKALSHDPLRNLEGNGLEIDKQGLNQKLRKCKEKQLGNREGDRIKSVGTKGFGTRFR